MSEEGRERVVGQVQADVRQKVFDYSPLFSFDNPVRSLLVLRTHLAVQLFPPADVLIILFLLLFATGEQLIGKDLRVKENGGRVLADLRSVIHVTARGEEKVWQRLLS